MTDPTARITVAEVAVALGYTASDTAKVQRNYDAACALVDEALAAAWREVPRALVDTAIIRAARALQGDKRGGGAGQGTQVNGGTTPPPMDPRRSIRVVLGDYLPVGLA